MDMDGRDMWKSAVREMFTSVALMAGLLPASHVQAANLISIVRQAEEHDPQFAEARANYGVAVEDTVQARAKLWLPMASINGSVGRNRQQGSQEVEGSQEAGPNQPAGRDNGNVRKYYTNTQFTLDITQPIYHHDRFISLRQMETRQTAASTQVSAAHQKLLLRVSERYFEVLAAQDNLVFARAEESALGSQLHQTQRRYDLGTLPITDLQEAQANYDLALTKTLEAQNQININKAQLREVLGDDVAELAPLGANVPVSLPAPAKVSSWIDTALQQNLEIAAAHLTSREASDEIHRQAADHLPSLDLRVTQGYLDTGGRLGAISVDTGVSLNLTIPIYEGGQVSSRTRQADFRHQATLNRLEQTMRSVRQQTETAFLGIQYSAKRITALSQAITSNTTAAKATQRGYELGTRTGIDVVLAQRNLARSRSEQARARYDYILNTLRLKQAAGTLSPQDILTVNAWLDASPVAESTDPYKTKVAQLK